MLWFFLALLTVTLWSFTNIFDKIFVTKYLKDPLVAPAVCSLMNLPILLVIVPVLGFTVPGTDWLLLLFVSSLFHAAASFLYFKAMQAGEVSRVITAINSMPIFVLILAVFFLGETPGPWQIGGIFLVVLGAMLVSQRRHFKLSGWFFVTLVSAALYSVDTVLHKFLLQGMTVVELVEWKAVFGIIIFTPIGIFYFKKLKKLAKENPKAFGFPFLAQAFFVSGRFSFVGALSLGMASLVSAVTAVQPFIILGLALVSTKLFPKWIKEEIDMKTVALKLLAVCLVVLGSVMLL